LRFGRPKVPNFTDPNKKFVIGKADILSEGKDVTIIATGHLVWKAIEAGRILAEKGIDAEIINMHTIKPLDEAAVLKSIGKTKCVVTAEEHMMNGGLGDSIAQLIVRNTPVPLEMVAVNDTFGESGTGEELLTKYHINTPDIVAAVERVVKRK
jgi:transketolase